MNGVDVGVYSTPALVDINNDGDFDAFIGGGDPMFPFPFGSTGEINYYENTGTATSPTFTERTGAANPFDGVNVGQESKPAFVDINNDGDFDAFIGEYDGNINYYENTSPVDDTTAPDVTIDAPTETAPAYREGGEQFWVNFTYTEENPKNYTVKIYNSSAVINTSSGDYPAGGENKVLNVSFHMNASAADGKYNVSVEMYDNASNYNISYQNESVVKFSPVTCTCGDICVNTIGWWRNNSVFNVSGTPIQAAVDNANAGETICVKDGTYNENVDVNKRLTIRSENGSASTIVNASSSSDHVFNVTVDYVNVSGFTVENATGSGKAGLYLGSGTDHCNITDNSASNNYYGVFLQSSSSNTLTNNTANSNDYYGIYLDNADGNEITCNWVAHNDQRGFNLTGGSTGNNISYNNIGTNGNYNSGTGGWEWNFYNGQSDAVVAEHNYWGTTSSAVIAAGIKADTGSVDYDPFETSSVPCAPIPEAATVVLLSIGLVVLAGYMRVRRKD